MSTAHSALYPAESQPEWWVPVLRGVAAILFGVLALFWPGLTLLTLVYLFGAYALVDGMIAIIGGFQQRGESDRWWVTVLAGVVGVIAGVLAFLWPGITGLALVLLIGARFVVEGILEIAAAIALRNEIEGEWRLGLAGLVSLIFGVLVLLFPAEGALALTWAIGITAILAGGLLIFLGFELRQARAQPGTGQARTA
jgi:uncharacterized membrane protein HdeD (DUF308 family)